MFDSRQWSFIADMNYSGSITIYDVWSWFKWLYFYPGDGFVYFLVNKFPGIGQFFEITYSSYGGVLSGVVSFFVWIIIISWIVGMISEFETKSDNPKPAILKPSIPINMTPSQAADPNLKHPSPKIPTHKKNKVRMLDVKDNTLKGRFKREMIISDTIFLSIMTTVLVLLILATY